MSDQSPPNCAVRATSVHVSISWHDGAPPETSVECRAAAFVAVEEHFQPYAQGPVDGSLSSSFKDRVIPRRLIVIVACEKCSHAKTSSIAQFVAGWCGGRLRSGGRRQGEGENTAGPRKNEFR